MTAVEKALRHIEKLIAKQAGKVKPKRPQPTKKSSATYEKLRRAGIPRQTARRESRESFVPPVTHPDFTELRESFAPSPTFEVSITDKGVKAIPPLPFRVEGGGYVHRAGVILADGSLLDDVREAARDAA